MLNHKGTQTLITPRLVLRPFVADDAQDMYINWASDPEVTKVLTWPTHKSVDISQWVCDDWVSHYCESDYYNWAIVYDGHAIGSIAVVEHDDKISKAQIGYCIGRNWWHMGIMAEALQAVMNFLFDEVGVDRIEARHDPRNSNSGHVMRKCGMKYEGTLRQSDLNNQGVCDACWYALVKIER